LTISLAKTIANNPKIKSQSWQVGTSWQESGSLELLDANAEACEQLLQQHMTRLQSAKSGGWWRTAVYIAGESEAAVDSVSGALRSLCSGDATSLDPMRTLQLPSHLFRNAIEHGAVLNLHPANGDQAHPLGSSFNTLGTCLSSEELSVLINLPQQEIPGLRMRDQSAFALSVPLPTNDSISLGVLQDGLGRDLGPVTITAAELNRHVFITGLTGYGKTNTCMQLLLEAYDKLGIPFLVLEPAKAEYRRLQQIQELNGRLRVYTIGDHTSLPLRLNPLSPVPGVPLGRHIDLLKSVFNASFPMFAGMPYVLEEALLEVYAERGWSLFTSQNPFLGPKPTLDEQSALTPCLQDLHDKIDVVLARKKYGEEVYLNMGAALRSRLRSLMVGNKGLALNTRRSTPLDDLFAAPTVIELRNLGDDEEKAFIMALLFVLLYEYAEIRQRDLPASSRGQLQHLTLVEEAHRLLQATRGPVSAEEGDPRAKAVSMFTDMLAEMRAYGEGFFIADQIPTKLTPEILKNSNLKIIHRLVAPDDRQAAGSCINLTEWQMRHLNNLSPGFAIVHDERIGEAVLTRIYPVKDTRAPERAEEELQAITKAVEVMDKRYLYRHAGCRSCPSPCDFYYRMEEAQNQKEMDRILYPFLRSLLADEADQAWEEWSGWQRHWQQNGQALRGAEDSTAVGITYCAVTQAAHDWLGNLLATPSEMEGKSDQLSPLARLRRETAARALGEFFIVWIQKAALDEESRTLFTDVQRRLQDAVADLLPYVEEQNEAPEAGQQFRDAETAYQETLATYRALAIDDPATYLPEVALTLDALGVLYHDAQQLADAEEMFHEALAIYRTLATDDPTTHLAAVARTLNNLASEALEQDRIEQAQEWTEEALAIRRELWSDDPTAHGDALARSLMMTARILSRTEAEATVGYERLRQAMQVASDVDLKERIQEIQETFSTQAD